MNSSPNGQKKIIPGEIVLWDFSFQGGSSQEENSFGAGKKESTIFNSIRSLVL